jgi:hypothetical protein
VTIPASGGPLAFPSAEMMGFDGVPVIKVLATDGMNVGAVTAGPSPCAIEGAVSSRATRGFSYNFVSRIRSRELAHWVSAGRFEDWLAPYVLRSGRWSHRVGVRGGPFGVGR